MLPSLVHVNHWGALLIFAAIISAVIGMLARRTPRRRLQYALWSFALFIVVSVGVAWLMYPFSH
jgi:hypothetical protein